MNEATKDQIASVMLQLGTPEQQEEALRYIQATEMFNDPDVYENLDIDGVEI